MSVANNNEMNFNGNRYHYLEGSLLLTLICNLLAFDIKYIRVRSKMQTLFAQ